MATRRGRPSVSRNEQSTDVHLTVPNSMYDRVHDKASTARMSIQEVIRRALAKDLETQNRQS